MKRIITILLAVLLLATVFAGCGSDETDPTTDNSSASGTQATTDPGNRNGETDPEATTGTGDAPIDATDPVDNPTGDDDPVGLYLTKTYYGMSVEDMISTYMLEDDMTIEEFLQEAGISSPGEIFTIELKADGTAIATNTTLDGQQSTDGTWTQSGDQVTVTIDGDPKTFTLSGNVLSVNESGLEFAFVRQ